MKINIASNEVVHFIGIGGIGMSGLAQIMKNMGFSIQGSDLNYNNNIERLIKRGIKVFIGHSKKNIQKATTRGSDKLSEEDREATRKSKVSWFSRHLWIFFI